MKDLLEELFDANIEITFVNGKLKARSAKGALSDELLSKIRANKSELTAYLKAEQLRGQSLSIDFDIDDLSIEDLQSLSYAEKRIWFEDKFSPRAVGYNMCGVFELSRPLDFAKLEESVSLIIEKHTNLRANYYHQDGEPIKRITDRNNFRLRHINDELTGAELETLIREEYRFKFDLESDSLLRVTYISRNNVSRNNNSSPVNDLLIVNFHHIIADGWSINIFINDLIELYDSGNSKKYLQTKHGLSYAQYTRSQNTWVSSGALDGQLQYLLDQLIDAPPTHSLPLISTRDSGLSKEGGIVERELAPQTLSKLKALASRNSSTLFMLVHSALSFVLCKYSGEDEIVIGTPVSGRHLSGVDAIIGCFINMIPLRSSVKFDRWNDYLDHIKEVNTKAHANQDVPFDLVVDKLGVKRQSGRSPVFQIMLTVEDENPFVLTFSGNEAREVKRQYLDVKMDLNVNVEFKGGAAIIRFEYDKSLFEVQFINRLASSLLLVLQEIIELDSSSELSEISFLDEGERNLLLHGLNETNKQYAHNNSVIELFHDQVEKRGSLVAVQMGDEALSYSALNALAEAILDQLNTSGVVAGQIVGICMSRSIELVASMLAVFKAGCAYVPVDPELPISRQLFILEDTQAPVCLTTSLSNGDGLSVAKNCHVLAVNRHTLKAPVSSEFTPPKHDEKDRAYILYTSGSTGNPKGVVLNQKALLNRLNWMQEKFELSESDAVLQKTPFTFDVSVWEFLWTLCWGARLVLAKPDRHKDPIYLKQLIQDKGVTVLHFVPSMLDAYLFQSRPGFSESVRLIVCSGEALKKETVSRVYELRKDVSLYNLYGPTEAAIDVSYFDCIHSESYSSVPIGVPISNIKLYVLDKSRCPVPIGVSGELYISGVGLAEGYLNNAELTRKVFVTNPSGKDDYVRMYKTGDIVRRLDCGNIEYLGRTDDQIKLHGQRIELGEIEAKLTELDAVESCVVIAHRDNNQNHNIVAYCQLISSSNKDVTFDSIREALRSRLPKYMMPSVFVKVEDWPRTTSGKIDKKSLPHPDVSLENRRLESPVSDSECSLRKIWAELLGCSEDLISCEDDFFQIGGNSLLAIKLSVKIEKEFGKVIDITTVFEQPTVRSLSKYLEGVDNLGGRSEVPYIERTNERYPASYFQKRMWFIDKVSENSGAYNMSTVFEVQGDVDIAVLETSISRVIDRHEILRTTYEEDCGEIYQKVNASYQFEIAKRLIDIKGSEGQIKNTLSTELGHCFSLVDGPVIRVTLFKDAGGRSFLTFCIHHIACDGWSIDILLNEVNAHYKALKCDQNPDLQDISIQYLDYAVWQSKQVSQNGYEEDLQYWTHSLKDAPEKHSIVTDYPRPLEKQTESEVCRSRYVPGVDLKKTLSALNMTEFMLMHAVLALVVSRNSASEDIVIGTPVANRFRADVEGLIGGFVNTLALRVGTENMGLLDYCEKVRKCNLSAQAHQSLPFDIVVDAVSKERSAAYTPLTQIVLTVNQADDQSKKILEDRLDFSDGRLDLIEISDPASKFDIELDVAFQRDEIRFNWIYDKSIFSHERISRIAKQFETLLNSIQHCVESSKLNTYLVALKALPDEEFNELVNDLNPIDKRKGAPGIINALFSKRAKSNPEAQALICGQDSMSYGELDQASDYLAGKLVEAGVQPGDFVGVCLNRSLDLVVSVLGILKSGCAYVPIDPEYPKERVEFIVEDSGTKTICMGDKAIFSSQFVQEHGLSFVDAHNLSHKVASGAQPFLSPELRDDSPAYVIYTSGSTGKPKGVVQTHRNVTRLFRTTEKEFEPCASDVWVLFHSISFDFSVWELWGALFYGGTLVIPDSTLVRDASRFLSLCESAGVTVLNQTPSAFKALSTTLVQEKRDLQSLRLVIFGGETLEPHSISVWKDHSKNTKTRFVNMYGITETTVHASFWDVDEKESASVIGRKLGDQKYFIFDKYGCLSPKYAVGELFIGGEGLALEYLNRKSLTDERFVYKQVDGHDLGRLYKTGDLVRYRPDGYLEYRGRNDEQVKVRGYRIELGEISNAIAKSHLFSSSHVAIRPDASGDKTIVAYLVSEESVAFESKKSELKKYIESILPGYMCPSSYIPVEKIPLTTNGKVNINELPLPEEGISASPETQHAATETEEKLLDIWSVLLGIDKNKIGVTDNFFAIGGHSLKVIQLVSKIRNDLQLDVDVATVLSKPTIRHLALSIDQANVNKTQNTRIKPVVQSGVEYSLSEHQRRMWYVDKMQGAGATYNIPLALRLEGELMATAVEKSLQLIVSNHSALRTVFKQGSDEPLQLIKDYTESPLSFVDLSKKGSSAETTLLASISQLISSPFDLEVGPLFQSRLYKLPANKGVEQHVLFLMFHHLVCDGWSLSIISKEFSQYYNEFSRSGKVNETIRPLQFVDYTEWTLTDMGRGKLNTQIEYWKNQLANIPQIHSLPLDKPRPQQPSFSGAYFDFQLAASQSQEIRNLAARYNTTPFVIFNALYFILIARFSGQKDIVIGVPTAGRSELESEGIVGFFVNTLVLRVDYNFEERFDEFLQKTIELNSDALKNQDVSFTKLLEEVEHTNSRSHTPIFQLMMSMDTNDQGIPAIEGVNVSRLNIQSMQSKYDLVLHVMESEGKYDLSFEYSSDLFEAKTIETMANSFLKLVESTIHQPLLRLGDLDIVGADFFHNNHEQHALPSKRISICLQELFLGACETHSENVAVYDENGSLTYKTLLASSLILKDKLVASGLSKGDIVAIQLPKGRNQVIAVLGVLMAGGIYLPIETRWPYERCEKILSKASARFAIVCEGLNKYKDVEQNLVIEEIFDNGFDPDTYSSDIKNVVPQNPDDLAYVIFTSGSTGEPKGVEIEHKSAVNTILAINDLYKVGSRDKVFAVSALSFDLSVYDIFGMLAVGGAIVYPDSGMEIDPQHWVEKSIEHSVTIWNSVPVSASLLFDQALNTSGENLKIHSVLMSGDWISPDLPKKIWQQLPDCHIYSLGGATEGSIWSIHYPILEDTSHLRSIPYGKPLPGQRFYILNECGMPLPKGVSGELHIGGVGVARGYCNAEKLTQERFVWNTVLGERLYKTGDHGRYMDDGNIEFLGRVDDQVKIRGFRVELGEIEAALLGNAMVKSVLVTIQGKETARDIVAYIVLNEKMDSDEAIRSVSKSVTSVLPDYMRPAGYCLLEKLPLTANGKVDKKALPAIQLQRNLSNPFKTPQSSLQSTLCEYWQQILGIENIGVNDDVYEHGANSLSVLRFAGKVRNELQKEVKLDELFSHYTVEAQEKLINKADGVSGESFVFDHKEMVPTSYAQRRLWFIDRLNNGSTEYNMPLGIIFEGELDIERLEFALSAVIDRHASLRTIFPEAQGQPFQKVLSEYSFQFETLDLSDQNKDSAMNRADELLEDEARHVFNLERDIPIKARLIVLSKSLFVLQINMHHIASDGWSLGVFSKELSLFYRDEQQAIQDLSVSYLDYAAWQNEWLQSREFMQDLNFWKDTLVDIDGENTIPVDFSRPKKPAYQGSLLTQTLGNQILEDVHKICREQNLTLFMFLQTVLAILVGRFSNKEDVIIGTAVSGRQRSELESLVGFFVNSLVLRSVVRDVSFRENLSRNKKSILEAYRHQNVPFDLIVEELNPERTAAHNPFFQIMFVLQNHDVGDIDIPGIKTELQKKEHNDNKFDIHLTAEEVDGQLHIDWIYDTALYRESTIRALMDAYSILISAAIRDLNSSAFRVPLEADTQEPIDSESLDSLKSHSESGDDTLIHRVFSSQVEQYPEQVAVTFSEASLSYEELEIASDKVAKVLVDEGVNPGDFVGLQFERSNELIVAILGILKSGAAYVPLDPEYPEERLEYIVEDSGLRLILTNVSVLRLGGVNYLDLNESQFRDQSGFSDAELPINLSGDMPAYVIYTSGSTGLPKGVIVSHKNVIRLFQSADQHFYFDDRDVWTLFHSYAFDFSVWEIWGALFYGGKLVVVPSLVTRSSLAFADLLEEQKVTVLNQTPSAFYPLMDTLLERNKTSSLRYVVFGGEALARNKLNAWFDNSKLKRTRLINMYGITETTVHVTYEELTSKDDRSGIIGRPLADLEVVVCNEHLIPQPFNVEGELLVSGGGLTLGYLNKPELTAEKFIHHTFTGSENTRWYRSGDLVKQLKDGTLVYVGRKDGQVKIRGFRIETGEVEAELLKSPEISEAVVLAQQVNDENSALVAYLKPNHKLVADFKPTRDAESVESWQGIFDDAYKSGSQIDLNRELDTSGWDCSYRELPIPLVEMHEWVESTVERIASLKPRSVLEVGVGTGMLLSKYAANCEKVVASDLSSTALQNVAQIVQEHGWDHVELIHGDALSIGDHINEKFDTVIINSVVQYFPSEAYFSNVLSELIKLVAEGGKILIGDVRNLDLLDEFSSSIALYQSVNKSDLKSVCDAAIVHRHNEEELIFSPNYFIDLQHKISAISGVDVLVKSGRWLNEMSKYRFDVVLTVDGQRDAKSVQWSRWMSDTALFTALPKNRGDVVGFYSMPNERISQEVANSKKIYAAYEGSDELSLTCPRLGRCDQFDSIGTKLAELGYKHWITYGQASADTVDLIVCHADVEVCFDIAPHIRETSGALNNFPQVKALGRELLSTIKSRLENSLPRYMLPQSYVVVEAFPLTNNGKINKNALPKWIASEDVEYVAPRDDTERSVQAVWQKVLNHPEIGIKSDFFNLGGHSLLVQRLVNEINREINVLISVREVFENPTIEDLSSCIKSKHINESLAGEKAAGELEEMEW